MIIKTLSIQQPWAGFILTGRKQVENRMWVSRYTGPLLIHAGKTEGGCYPEYYGFAGIDIVTTLADMRFRRGAIVGIAYKEACIESHRTRMEPLTPWHDEGAVWWPLKNAWTLCTPIYCNGKRSVYDTEIDPETRILNPQVPGAFMSVKDYVETYRMEGK